MKRLSKLKFIMCFLCAVLSANAQDITLSGVVTDVNKEPLIGVNVVQKGTTKGTVTSYDGEFSFAATPGSTIILSYIGFQEHEVVWNGRIPLNITLHEDSELFGRSCRGGLWHTKKSESDRCRFTGGQYCP